MSWARAQKRDFAIGRLYSTVWGLYNEKVYNKKTVQEEDYSRG